MRFDILMPTILFVVTLVAMFLGRKAEVKLKSAVQEREFKTRDTILMIVVIGVAVSIVIFVPSMAIMALFLFSYSSLLFTISHAFSDMRVKGMRLYCGVFVVASLLAAIAGALGVLPADVRLIGVASFAALAAISLTVLLYTQRRPTPKQKWYVAALSPVLFLLLFVFFSGAFFKMPIDIWFPYLLDVYGIIFALLIVLYLNSLFNWKTVFIFAGFLTGMDIVLVWVTGTMVQAAEHISGLGLPVLVAFPTLPPIFTTTGDILIMRLGLGDFFFAGILASQTLKRFGKKTAVASLLTICISFAVFELILLNPELSNALPVPALPATLPILVGWLPVILVKMFLMRKEPKQVTPIMESAPSAPAEATP
jgi:hypothetical protein